jgi:DNA-binding winged helix-turn-helix (wHTH) protein/TolB-like protein
MARVQFGAFDFDIDSGTLSRQGLPVRLQPQPARVLAVLVSRAGEVVSREELRQEIWPEGTFVDFHRGLNFSVAQIRSALGDSANDARYVETLPKRGYRFVAPVTHETPAGAESPTAIAVSAPASELPSLTTALIMPPRQRALATAALVMGILVAVVGLVAMWNRPSAHGTIRVAVVPFDNETGQDAYDGVAVAIADQTVARLATPDRLRELRVIGNAAELRKPRSFRDIKGIGQAVNADYVVLAQMKIDDSKVRLIAHLIRVSDQVHLWADVFDRPMFTLDVQAEIAEAIARAVTTRLAS